MAGMYCLLYIYIYQFSLITKARRDKRRFNVMIYNYVYVKSYHSYTEKEVGIIFDTY